MTDEEIASQLSALNEKVKSAHRRLDTLEETQKQILDLTLAVRDLTATVKDMKEGMGKTNERLERIEQKPVERVEFIKRLVVTAIVTALASGVIGWLIGFLTRGV